VKAAVRLANNHQERYALRKQLTGEEKVKKLFHGRPHLMADSFLECLQLLKPAKKSRAQKTSELISKSQEIVDMTHAGVKYNP